MLRPGAIALAALAAQITQPAPGWGVLLVLLGVLVAAALMMGGHAIWVWRRRQGPLKSADDVVRDLAASQPDTEDDRRRDRSA
jgi:hypothetical protein